ncbi:MAG: ABC transporter permease [Verrucomicrobia bacterium]|nr:ABC transporter permease [Verrucomicrobiota bacterium]MCF7707425.1 ABC transporter permease [Verrucomicrobiota bacterium]
MNDETPRPAMHNGGSGMRPGFNRLLGGVWLMTWRSELIPRRVPLLILIICALPGLVYATVNPGDTRQFYKWLIDMYFLLILPLYCLMQFGAMIRDEVQEGTLGFLISRPAKRWSIFLSKYVCRILMVEIIAGVNLVLLFAVGWLRDIQGVIAVLPAFLAIQVIAVPVWGAISSLFGLIHKKYLVLGIVYGFVVEFGIGRIPGNINTLSLIRQFKTILAQLKPVREFFEWSAEGMGIALLVLACATVVYLAAGVILFVLKEYTTSDEVGK